MQKNDENSRERLREKSLWQTWSGSDIIQHSKDRDMEGAIPWTRLVPGKRINSGV